jgi:hypothetical protein
MGTFTKPPNFVFIPTVHEKEGEMYLVEGNFPLQPKDDGNIYE